MLRRNTVTIAALLLISCAAHAEIVADLVADWNQALVDSGDTRAPQGSYNWTYGSIPASGSTFSQFTGVFGAGTSTWANDNIYSTGAFIGQSENSVIRNTSGYLAGASWDSEVTGEIRIIGSFHALATNQWTYGNKALLRIMVNGALVNEYESVANTTNWGGSYPPAFDPVAYDVKSFDVTLNVVQGDDVQILSTNVGTMDYTLIKAQIETVPEPATMGLLGLGGAMALLRRRRQA